MQSLQVTGKTSLKEKKATDKWIVCNFFFFKKKKIIYIIDGWAN